MALLPGLRRRLEERFACPVADLYSMNEAGPVAVFDPEWLNNLEVTHALQGMALAQYRLHQSGDKSLHLAYCAPADDTDAICQALHRLFGAAQTLDVERAGHFDGKVI